jgi:polysaccharide export outer membrane protein
VISVGVFGQEAMGVRRKVLPNGEVAIPLLGHYVVAGKRPAAVAQELEARLKPFVTSPHVSVVVEEANIDVVVLGEVGRSGRFSIPRPAYLAHALADAGGLGDFADDDAIFVLRDQARIRFTYEQVSRGLAPARSFRLRTGDVIVVE